MICKKCGAQLTETANFCHVCGKPVNYTPTHKKRGNGQGSVYKTPSGNYRAIVTLGYYIDEDGKRHRRTKSKVFEKKKDAVAALPDLAKDERKERKQQLTFKQLYDLWMPTHRAGEKAMHCYTAAIKHFSDVYHMRVADIEIEDLQDCVDNCPAGKRTRQNMKTVVGLMYKYGIPRHMIPENLNLSQFICVSGESAAHRESFSDVQIEKIRAAVGKVAYADYIVIMIYTGFRPSEFLSLTVKDYDTQRHCFTGGAKTDAGKGRRVTASPKIQPLINAILCDSGGSDSILFPNPSGKQWDLKQFTEKAFYPALEAIGIETPLVEVAGGVPRHKYTPHSCRHTFSTLLKRVSGTDKDKLELIGHTSTDMLRYYQDVDYKDLEAITNAL